MTRQLNTAALELIKRWEGWRATAYPDPATGGEPLTIGYGHTSAAGAPAVKRGMTITRAEGEAILRRDLQKYVAAVEKLVKVPLNDNQFGALVSFCYNVGPGNFKSSSVLERVNAKRFEDVPLRLLLWNKANGKTMRGLTSRRVDEGNLFKLGSVKKPVAAAVEPAAPAKAGFLAALFSLIARLFGRK